MKLFTQVLIRKDFEGQRSVWNSWCDRSFKSRC